jgi:hypothetical protein
VVARCERTRERHGALTTIARQLGARIESLRGLGAGAGVDGGKRAVLTNERRVWLLALPARDKASCFENAVADNFSATLEREWLDPRFRNRTEARFPPSTTSRASPSTRRLHSALGDGPFGEFKRRAMEAPAGQVLASIVIMKAGRPLPAVMPLPDNAVTRSLSRHPCTKSGPLRERRRKLRYNNGKQVLIGLPQPLRRQVNATIVVLATTSPRPSCLLNPG